MQHAVIFKVVSLKVAYLYLSLLLFQYAFIEIA